MNVRTNSPRPVADAADATGRSHDSTWLTDTTDVIASGSTVTPNPASSVWAAVTSARKRSS